MKRFFYFLAMSAVVLGMAFTFGNGAHLINFKIEVASVDETTIVAKIIPAKEDSYFTLNVVPSEEFFKNKPEYYVQKLKDQAKEYNVSYPELLLKGEIEEWSNCLLDPGQEYVLYIFEVDENYDLVGEVEYIIFKTAGQVSQTANFTVTITNITATSAHVRIDPKEGVHFYCMYLTEKKYYTQYKDELFAAFSEEDKVGAPIEDDYPDLTPDAEHIIILVKVDENGKLLEEVETVTFRTPDMETVELPKKELTGYVAYGILSSITIYAKDTNDKDKYHIVVNGSNLTGSFSTKDLIGFGSISSCVEKEGKRYPIFRTNFTGRKGGETTYIYEGWFDCIDGNRYNLKITCVYNSDL